MSGTRAELHRISTHILARRRFEVGGHFGLRAGPGGIATPAFGPEPEVIRIAAATLVREVGGAALSAPINGSTIRDLADFACADLTKEFSCGDDAPPLGDVTAPLRLEPEELDRIVGWFDLGWRVLDAVASTVPREVATIQLWPEHFDIGTTVPLPTGQRTNLGFSPGDSYSEEPYVYVGPWIPQRPGGGEYWNAPFGAALARSHLAGVPDVEQACIAFIAEGIDRLSSG